MVFGDRLGRSVRVVSYLGTQSIFFVTMSTSVPKTNMIVVKITTVGYMITE